MLILYNTVMGLSAGIALLLMVAFARWGASSPAARASWAWSFGALGAILFVLGVAMNVMWPLPGPSNIIFGEPSVLFGAVLVAAAFVLARTPASTREPGADEALAEPDGTKERSGPFRVERFPKELAVALRPISYVGGFVGLMVVTLGVVGAAFGQFRPAPGEWPGMYLTAAGLGWLETVYVVVTFCVAGLGAMLLPLGLHRPGLMRPAAICLGIGGLLLVGLSYGALVGHVSLAVDSAPGGFELGG